MCRNPLITKMRTGTQTAVQQSGQSRQKVLQMRFIKLTNNPMKKIHPLFAVLAILVSPFLYMLYVYMGVPEIGAMLGSIFGSLISAGLIIGTNI